MYTGKHISKSKVNYIFATRGVFGCRIASSLKAIFEFGTIAGVKCKMHF
jgi:hypothetical protein